MSRSGYIDDWDDTWATIRARGAVVSASTGKRGQAFFRDLRDALDAMPAKRLVSDALVREDSTGFENVCALGALGKARGIDMKGVDPDDSRSVAALFGIAESLAREVVYNNDEANWDDETPEQRWTRVRRWVDSQILKEKAS